jgi:hypothetical protein
MAETVEHVIAEKPDAEAHEEAIADTAAVAVATAGAATALAQETAAHAELQAAEEVAEVEAEVETWQMAIASQHREIGTALQSLNDRLSAIDSREEERHREDELLAARLQLLEDALAEAPEEPEAETTSPSSNPETSEEAIQTAPIVGTEAAANVGPVAVSGETSLHATEATTSPSPSRRAPRRWI